MFILEISFECYCCFSQVSFQPQHNLITFTQEKTESNLQGNPCRPSKKSRFPGLIIRTSFIFNIQTERFIDLFQTSSFLLMFLQINNMDIELRPDNQRIGNSNSTLMETEFVEQTQWSPMVVLIAVLLGILISLTSIGNLVVCRLVWVCRRMQIPSLYFVASMSFSDFLMGLLVMPISLAYHITYQTTGKDNIFSLIFAPICQNHYCNYSL